MKPDVDMVWARIIAPSAEGKNLQAWRDSAKVLAIESEARGNQIGFTGGSELKRATSALSYEPIKGMRIVWMQILAIRT